MRYSLSALLIAWVLFVPISSHAEPLHDPFYPALQNDTLFDIETYQKVRDITIGVS